MSESYAYGGGWIRARHGVLPCSQPAEREPSRTPLQVRHAAALKLVAAGELDPAFALSLVVWPPAGSRLADDQVSTRRQTYPPELKAEIRRRHAQGETTAALAASTGVPSGTVKGWLRHAGRRNDAGKVPAWDI
jgi:DNA-directed RNA polymerase specialized sigma24 family protein